MDSALAFFFSEPPCSIRVRLRSLPALFWYFLYENRISSTHIRKLRKLTRVSECGEFVMRVIQGALMAEWIKTLLSYQLSIDAHLNGVGMPHSKGIQDAVLALRECRKLFPLRLVVAPHGSRVEALLSSHGLLLFHG